MKRLASLILSLLICLSLSATPAKAGDLPEPAVPPAQVEVLDPENPDGPDDPGIMLLAESYPGLTPGQTDDGET